MKTIVCVYTSEKQKYADARARLEADPWFAVLRQDPDVTIIDVVSDERVQTPVLSGGVLRLPMPDDYLRLSQKTFTMIEYLSTHEHFDFLVKIDDTTVDSEYMQWIRSAPLSRLCRRDYGGVRTFVSGLYVKAWLEMKHISVKKPIPMGIPFFGGKLYVCSSRACAAIAAHGRGIADRYTRDHAGVEDLFVAVTLYRHFFPRWKMPFLFLSGYVRYVLDHFRLQSTPHEA